jgi:hypothetical protein
MELAGAVAKNTGLKSTTFTHNRNLTEKGKLFTFVQIAILITTKSWAT